MQFWIDFWSWFFFVSLALFAALALIVSVGGFFDVLSLFKKLTAHARQQQEGSSQTDDDQT